MSDKNISLIKNLAKKNIIDSVVLGIVAVCIVYVLNRVENISLSIIYIISLLVLYFIVYQISRFRLIKSIDKIVDNELSEFEKVSSKIVQVNEKQKQLANQYTEMINEVVQTTKTYKNNAIKYKEKTQSIAIKLQETYENSGRESRSLESNISAMNNLKQKIQAIAELIIELTDYIKQIGSTINIVENISEQTNMLALNAAVEAARAGEYGKGFAVVAGEIRKLADESKQATTKITALVSEIEQTTSSTIMATEDGTREIENAVRYTSGVCANILSLVVKIKELNSDINEMLASSIEQQSVADDIMDAASNTQRSISESVNIMEENIQNIKTFSEISTNIKDNIVN